MQRLKSTWTSLCLRFKKINFWKLSKTQIIDWKNKKYFDFHKKIWEKPTNDFVSLWMELKVIEKLNFLEKAFESSKSQKNKRGNFKRFGD